MVYAGFLSEVHKHGRCYIHYACPIASANQRDMIFEHEGCSYVCHNSYIQNYSTRKLSKPSQKKSNYEYHLPSPCRCLIVALARLWCTWCYYFISSKGHRFAKKLHWRPKLVYVFVIKYNHSPDTECEMHNHRDLTFLYLKGDTALEFSRYSLRFLILTSSALDVWKTYSTHMTVH